MPEQNNNNIWGNLPSSQAEALANLMRGGAYFLLQAANHFENQQTNTANAARTPRSGDQSVEASVTTPTENPVNLVADAAEALLGLHTSPSIPHPTEDQAIESPSSSSAEEESEEQQPTTGIWPNGNVTYVAENSQLKGGNKKIPYFGWGLCMYNSKTASGGVITRRWYCLGVHKCQANGCNFMLQPANPSPLNRRKFEPPPPSKYRCPVHSNQPLQWIKCDGGNGDPCSIVSRTEAGSSSPVEIEHIGFHNHPRAPRRTPTPQEREQLQSNVLANPSRGPRKLKNDMPTGSPLRHQGRVKKMRQTILQNRGIRTNLSSMLQFIQDCPKNRNGSNPFVDLELVDSNEMIITLQTDYMADIVHEAATGFQTDTVEGVIYDNDWEFGKIDLHITSCYDQYLRRWAPGLISIIFGRKTSHYARHFKVLFNSAKSSSSAETWKQFTDSFPGVTADWASAIEKGYKQALLSQANQRSKESIRRSSHWTVCWPSVEHS